MKIEYGDPQGRRFIVAEISKTWTGEETHESPHVRELFEDVIGHNEKRGYRLHSWNYGVSAYPTRVDGDMDQDRNHRVAVFVHETIVAVFERVDPEGLNP